MANMWINRKDLFLFKKVVVKIKVILYSENAKHTYEEVKCITISQKMSRQK